MNNIAHFLFQASKERPKQVAVICKKSGGYRSWSYSELEDAVRSFGSFLLKEGVKPGDRTVLMVKPSMEFVALTFALFSIGAVVILIDPGMGYKNLLKCIGSVKPKAFIGIPKAHLFRKLFPKPFKTVRTNICVGVSFGLFGRSLRKGAKSSFKTVSSAKDDLAAIIFTTGSTGPPKGVQYQHGVFKAQLAMIHDYYGVKAGDIDQPAFPLFALFSIALGATAVIPDMNPTKPAKVNPVKFIRSIQDHGVTYSFGSPAIWNVISNYCQENQIQLPTLKKILMAGAPVPGDLVKRVRSIMAEGGVVHTPYGATEALPIVSHTGDEIVQHTWPLTRKGKGTCVGRVLPGIDIRIIAATDSAIPMFEERLTLAKGEVGEIIVKGEVVTKAYDNNPDENNYAKIKDKHNHFWHRMGDMGYFDNEGRLWFCGRKAHRVLTEKGPMYSVCCESIFNNHPKVYRSALVGIGPAGKSQPVLIVEPSSKIDNRKLFFDELKDIANSYSHTESISNFLIHPSFPVDIRHNAKIFREKLAVWAETKTCNI